LGNIEAQIPPIPMIDPTKSMGEKPILPVTDPKTDNNSKKDEMNSIEEKTKSEIEADKEKL
jgi:hypothetical protein